MTQGEIMLDPSRREDATEDPDYWTRVDAAAEQALASNDLNAALRAHEGDLEGDALEQFHHDVQLTAAPEVLGDDGPDGESAAVADTDSGNADEKGA